MPENQNPFNGVTVDKFTITLESFTPLVTLVGECETRYRWKRNDGEIVSPEFSTIQCAKLYAERMPLMPDNEWIESDPSLKLPEHA